MEPDRRHLGLNDAEGANQGGGYHNDNVQVDAQQAAVGQDEGKIPYDKASLLRKIVAHGMPKQETKALRELFPNPSFEGSFVL